MAVRFQLTFLSVILIFILALILGGCAASSQQLNPAVLYKRDMLVTVNGFQGDGVLVAPKADSYTMQIDAQGKLDLFTLTTCHREQTREKAGEKGWFKDKSRVALEFIPVPGIESGGFACPLELGGYEQVKGRHSWALIDFEDPGTDLPAKLKCNGSESNTRGVSICQSRQGLVQEITFSEPVLAAEKGVCAPMKASADGKRFQFEMPKGQCTFRFLTRSGAERWHRLTTFGYEQILIRE
jgi:hypothetical protein